LKKCSQFWQKMFCFSFNDLFSSELATFFVSYRTLFYLFLYRSSDVLSGKDKTSL
jgi:hypothetical protein